MTPKCKKKLMVCYTPQKMLNLSKQNQIGELNTRFTLKNDGYSFGQCIVKMKNVMKRKIWILTALIGACIISASAQKPNDITGLSNPESIGGHGKYLYVSNLGAQLDPTAKDGDGFISKVDRKTGQIVEKNFITGLNSPKGIMIVGGYIHVADVDKIVAYRIKDKKKVWEADLSGFGVTYANDIAMGCFKLYVSSTDRNAIFIVRPSGKIKMVKMKDAIPGANGLYKSCGKLYVANYGRGTEPNGSFGRVKPCKGKFKPFITGGIYDGITKVGGKLIVSDWVSEKDAKGKLVVYAPCSKKYMNLDMDRTFNGPADIYKDCKYRTLYIPSMRDNTVVSYRLKDVKAKIREGMKTAKKMEMKKDEKDSKK